MSATSLASSWRFFCGVVVSAPRNKHHKREQHAVKQAEGIEDDRSYFVILLQDIRRILLSHQVKACQSEGGRNRRDDEK